MTVWLVRAWKDLKYLLIEMGRQHLVDVLRSTYQPSDVAS